MWDYFLKSELILATDMYYIIEVWKKDGSTLKKQLDFNIEQAEIEYKNMLKAYSGSAYRIVLSIYVSSLCSTNENAQLAVKDLKKIYPNFTTFEISGPVEVVDYYKVSMSREFRSYYPKVNMEFFAPDYWGLDKPNK